MATLRVAVAQPRRVSSVRTTVVAPAPADVGPERLAPAVGEVLRVVEILDRRQLVAARTASRSHIAVFGSTGPSDRYSAMPSMNHSGSRSTPVSPAHRVRARRDVVLERVHELVADHVVGVGQRPAEREDDAPLQRLGDAARALAQLARDRRWSARSRGGDAYRTSGWRPCSSCSKQRAQPRVPSLRQARRDARRLLAPRGRSRCRSARSSGPGSRGPCTGPCSGRSTAPRRATATSIARPAIRTTVLACTAKNVLDRIAAAGLQAMYPEAVGWRDASAGCRCDRDERRNSR